MSARNILTALVLTLALASPAAATHEPPPPWPEHDRIYLMAAGTDYLHWSVDPSDPELDQSLVVRNCGATRTQGIPGSSKPCLTGGLGLDRSHTLHFLQASLFETQPSWDAEDPLRFRLALEAEVPVAYTVHLVLQQGVTSVESPPATEVAPGVWEGELGTGQPLGTFPAEYFGVRIRTQSQWATLRVKTGGESWIDLPEPIGAKGVPDLLADDTYRKAPTELTGGTRTMRFNDEAWQAWSFSGDVGEVRTFDFDLPETAVALIAWAELFDSPFLQDVRRGGSADARKVVDGIGLRFLRDGGQWEHGGGPFDAHGIDTVATTSMPAGEVQVEVSGYDNTDDPMPYTGYLVAVYGDRTLGSMRWRSTGHEHGRLPVVGVCPAALEMIPVMPEVTTFHVDLDWDTDAIGAPAWTVRYDVPGVGSTPCSEGGTGDNVRFTIPGEGVWRIGATPAYDAAFVSLYDTVYDLEVRYTYTAPPKEHEEEGSP